MYLFIRNTLQRLDLVVAVTTVICWLLFEICINIIIQYNSFNFKLIIHIIINCLAILVYVTV